MLCRRRGGKWHPKKLCRGSGNTLRLPSPLEEPISLQAKNPKRENARSTWLLKVRSGNLLFNVFLFSSRILQLSKCNSNSISIYCLGDLWGLCLGIISDTARKRCQNLEQQVLLVKRLSISQMDYVKKPIAAKLKEIAAFLSTLDFPASQEAKQRLFEHGYKQIFSLYSNIWAHCR